MLPQAALADYWEQQVCGLRDTYQGESRWLLGLKEQTSHTPLMTSIKSYQ
jgi:hypothetical protein